MTTLATQIEIGWRASSGGWIAAVALLAAGGCYPEIRGQPGRSQPPLVEVIKLQRTPLTPTTRLIGKSEPSRESTLYFEVSGVVCEVLVEEGDTVEADTPIAQLILRDYELNVALTRAQLEAAQAGLALLRAGTRKEDLEAAEADFARAQTRATYWKGEWERYVKLYGNTAISESDRDRVLNEYNAAVQEERATKARWQRAEAGPRQEEIDEAVATVEARQRTLELAQRQLDKATLYAPFSGRVETRMLDPGAYVNVFPMGGVPVVRIVDMDEIDVVFDVPERLVERCSEKETLIVASAVQPALRGEASIVSVGQVADPSSGTYRLRARIANQEHQFSGGMVLTTDIASTPRQAIQIPLNCVGEAFGQPPYVLLVDPTADRIVLREILLGAVLGDLAEVTHGLSPDELLVVRGQDRVLAGDHVRYREFLSTPVAQSEKP